MALEDEAERAWRAFAGGDAAQGLREIDRLLTVAPRNAAALTTRARMLLGLARPRDAALTVREALAVAPGRPDALAALAIALHRSSPGEAADRAVQTALERCLGPAERAELTFALGRFEEAGDAWSTAATDFAKAGDEERRSEAAGSAGVAFHLGGRHEDAVRLLRTATGCWVQLQGHDVHTLLIDSLCELGRWGEAWDALPSAEDCRTEGYGFAELQQLLVRRWPERFDTVDRALHHLATELARCATVTSAEVVGRSVLVERGHGTCLSVTPVEQIAGDGLVPWQAWRLRHRSADLRQLVATSRLLRWSDLAQAVLASARDLRQAYEEQGQVLRAIAACGTAFDTDGRFTLHRFHDRVLELSATGSSTDLDVRLVPTEIAGRVHVEATVRLYPHGTGGVTDVDLGVLPLDRTTIVAAVAATLPQVGNGTAHAARGAAAPTGLGVDLPIAAK